MEQYLKRLLSRKLLFSFFSVICVCLTASEIMKLKVSDSVLITALVMVVGCITIICVTFVTGLAKIDIQAIGNISAGLKKE